MTGNSSAARNIDVLIKEARRTHPSTRWLVYAGLAKDYGDGFAKVVQARVEEAERRTGQRAPRAQRKEARDAGNA